MAATQTPTPLLAKEELRELVLLWQTLGKPEPTGGQMRTFCDAVRLWEKTNATLVFSLDEDGSMLLGIRDDGLLLQARFAAADGMIVGNWF